MSKKKLYHTCEFDNSQGSSSRFFNEDRIDKTKTCTLEFDNSQGSSSRFFNEDRIDETKTYTLEFDNNQETPKFFDEDNPYRYEFDIEVFCNNCEYPTGALSTGWNQEITGFANIDYHKNKSQPSKFDCILKRIKCMFKHLKKQLSFCC